MKAERSSKRGQRIRGATPLLVAVVALGCSASSPRSERSPESAAPAVRTNRTPPLRAAATSAAKPADAEPILLVTDPRVLASVERKGFALGDALVARATGPVDNARLAASSRYASVAEVISADVALVAKEDPQAGVGVHRFSHRLFDVRWLSAKTARFELAAVVNRIDRAPFHPGSCGETRLVYRLAYATTVKQTPVASRLPMTLGLEIPMRSPATGCAEVARRFVPRKTLEGDELASWLTAPTGPLEAAMPALREAKLVVNVQQLRWPSAVRPDLAGHAEYLLRSFALEANGNRYAPAPLENTPNLERFAKDPALRGELVEWLADPENLETVDRGTPLLPERFLASRAVSVTPRGLSRKANRPFTSFLSTADFASVEFSGLERVRSAEGLLRRLDGLTCQGCHESRSIAGFHLLGDDPEATPAGNAVATGASPHLREDLARRRTLVHAMLAGEAAPDFSQPYPERGAYAGYGAHCGLSADPSFASWTCDSGLSCQAYDAPAGDAVGQCLPNEPRAAGDPCEAGPLDTKRDRVARVERKACSGDAVCNTNAVGFPGGMCTETCSALSASSVCGSIALLEPFNACVARGEPFFDCLGNNVRPAGFRACDANTPCRDDYVCTKAANGPRGTCIPPYFLFQLRVDGHP
jgi:hypothetical protein